MDDGFSNVVADGIDGMLATGEGLVEHILITESAAYELRFRFFAMAYAKPGDIMKTRSCSLLRLYASHSEAPM